MTRAFEIGPIRPPSEANSLLLQVTQGCTWNKCKFCVVYRGSSFHTIPPEKIMQNIDNMAYFRDLIASCVNVSSADRAAAAPTKSVADSADNDKPAAEQESPTAAPVNLAAASLDKEKLYAEVEKLSQEELHCFMMVYNWLLHGGKNVFLQDGNSVALKPEKLAEVLVYLRKKFPHIERITTYGRAETLSRWSVDQLKLLREAGLDRIHTGFESGSDKVLELVNKGLTPEQQIRGGCNVKEAGMELSVYFMPGIGGLEFSEENARETARVVNEIGPDFVRLRTFVMKHDSELYQMELAGEFEECSDIRRLEEIREMIELIDRPEVNIVSDHIVNLIGSLNGCIGTDKARLLNQIDRVLSLDTDEQRLYQLARRHGMIEDYPQLYSLSEQRIAQLKKIAYSFADELEFEAHINSILRNYV